MYRVAIAIVDASRARLFVFERAATASGLEEELREVSDLINPARRLRKAQLFSDPPGLARSGNLQYGIDNHQNSHLAQLDAQFATSIFDQLEAIYASVPIQRLVLCASPNMLAEVRDLADTLPRELVIDELPRDLVRLTPQQIRSQLAEYGLLPPPVPRTAVVRA